MPVWYPQGQRPATPRSPMPRYVILHHDWPTPHFDLFLEAGGVLKSWRLLAEPRPGVTVPATPNHDHRVSVTTALSDQTEIRVGFAPPDRRFRPTPMK